ncbi:bacterio-opsin activator domain-containing protein [Halorussus halophilus]|uniref:bacterio-opsin activator domain-containing protein n=1 Tax=Halorussus halophilus TaxID=2650975 RepID=UPI0013012562|nr:bacterio-opsin activator domain-containing protein [Halorussus halophilus]
MAVRKRVSTTEAFVEVEFALSNPEYPFVGASALEACRMSLEEIIPRGEDGYAEFFNVEDANPESILEAADEHGSVDAELLHEGDERLTFEFVVGDNCPAVFLGEQGALCRTIESENGEGRIVAEIPPHTDADAIVEQFLDEHPEAELVSKTEQQYRTQLFSHRDHEEVVSDELNDAEQDVLDAADSSGYYEWPQEATEAEVAEQVELSPTETREHIESAEQKLVSETPERLDGSDEETLELV